MYVATLLAHSWTRWVVLSTGLGLLTVAGRGWRKDVMWGRGAARLHKGFLGVLDLQLVLGLLLYAVLSPLSRSGLSDLAATLSDPVLRFYTIEHAFGMVTGVLVAHIGAERAKRFESARRYRVVFGTQLLWLLITLLSVPWPGLDYGRPLFRG